MPNVNERLRDLPTEDWTELQRILDDFEQALHCGGRPAVAEYAARLAAGHSATAALLAELVHLELEYRLKAGEPARVEEYLRAYPALAGDADLTLELIQAEHRLRQRTEPRLGPDEYLHRFPQYRAQLAARLAWLTAASTPSLPGEPETSLAPGGAPAAAVAELGLDLRAYELHEPLGQGGMGEVYRTRDPGLDRDLAIKVIRACWRGQAESERRFRREARATGLLQHPGIPPVHSFGRLPDGRLYYTMKLVRGRTLAQVLADPDLDRAGRRTELLQVFESICQAVAYAHSKGVIHRDLKPANVMVGEFGEVQVMDWGLAKILTADEAAPAGPGAALALGAGDERGLTEQGQALGTLLYMPPEQARGDAALVDQRSDVFALGAILCEILTGAPPYRRPEDWNRERYEALRQAQEGDLADAQARLAGCGADAELVAVARRALAAQAEERPRDAGELAGLVGGYLRSVEARLRQAEVERAAAEARAGAEQQARAAQQARAEAEHARARTERQRRRVAVALAALAVVLVVLGSAAGLWWALDRAARASRHELLEGDIAAALDLARKARDQLDAQLRQPGGVRTLLNKQADWRQRLDAARASLRHAQSRVHDAEGPVRDELVSAMAALEDLLDQDERSFQLARRLEKIREDRSVSAEGWKRNFARSEREHARAFTEVGLSLRPGQERQDALRLQQAPIKEQLLAALDDWVLVALQVGKKDLAEQLLRVARAADPDPWRDRVRDPGLWRNRPALEQLANQALKDREFLGRLSPQMLFVVGVLLTETKAKEAWLRQALVLYPGDFWLNMELGDALSGAERREVFRRAALAIRPESSAAWIGLGAALADQGHHAEAIRHYEQALKINPDSVEAHYNWGLVLYRQGHYAEAIRHFQQAFPSNSSLAEPELTAEAHLIWGAALHAQKQYAEAIAHYRQALKSNPKLAEACLGWGAALYDRKDYAGAIRRYQQALQINPNYAEAHHNWGNTLVAQKRYAEAIAHYRQALKCNPKLAEAHRGWAAVLYRRNDYAGAIRHYQQALQINPNLADVHYRWAAALHNQGHLAEAIAHYQQALQINPNDAAAHVDWGAALLAQEHYAEAIRHFEQALKIDPSLAGAHLNWGTAAQIQGHHAEAIRHYQQALKINPNLAEAHYNWGNTLKAQGHYAEAIHHYQQALKFKSTYFEAHLNWGTALHAQKRYAEAIAHYRQALQINPNLANAHYSWGTALTAQKRYAEAIGHFQQAVQINPNLVNGHLNCGDALNAEKRYTEAIAYLRQALKIDPKLANAHSALGQALLALGHFAEAKEATARALKLLVPGHTLQGRVQGQLAECERLLALERRLAAVLQGASKPKDSDEQLALAQLCQTYKKQHATAARFYADAFTAAPNLEHAHRYHAACAAALAAAGQGANATRLDAKERARWRRQALDWLRDDLVARARQLDSGSPEARAMARRALGQWQADPDLLSVRDEAALKKLLPEEQDGWREFWQNVTAARDRAAQRD
jgi:tetratricopeptide (TPR) repeat protein